mmetsp:Transcript_24135/g.35949  ORF Transcript_24135/g.35949 Transcript_24135/m.35949 type:complete len:116 (-) Transcript_24135:199-546(-)
MEVRCSNSPLRLDIFYQCEEIMLMLTLLLLLLLSNNANAMLLLILMLFQMINRILGGFKYLALLAATRAATYKLQATSGYFTRDADADANVGAPMFVGVFVVFWNVVVRSINRNG